MYIDYFLKFDSEDAAMAALFDVQEDSQIPKYSAVDLVGVIYKPTGTMLATEEGDVPEMAPLAGYHANVRLTEDAPELEPYRVFPVTPSRMWA